MSKQAVILIFLVNNKCIASII